MALKKIVSIDLGFDCSSETERPWDIADAAIDRINAFLEGEPGQPPIGVATQNFKSGSSSLYVNIKIPVLGINAAAQFETRLDNNLESFPPLLNNLRRFNYWSEIDLEVPPEE